jgi:hypothetical protein
MKKILILLGILSYTHTEAQQITGRWFSGDSSRVYEIRAVTANSFEAVIQTSLRKTDSTGFIVIKELHYNKRKKRHEGIMYAVSDKRPCFVKINITGNQLILKLRRMFVFDLLLKWSRANTLITATAEQ